MNSSTTLTQSIEFLNSLTSPFEFLSLTPFTLPWAATDFSEHSPPSFPFLSFFPIDPWTIASKAIANSSKNFPFPHFLLRLLLIGTLSCLLLRSISANRWCISSTFWNNRLNYWTSLNSFIRWPLNGPFCISPIDHLSQSHPSTSTLPTSCLNMAESATVRALLILKKIKQQEDEENQWPPHLASGRLAKMRIAYSRSKREKGGGIAATNPYVDPYPNGSRDVGDRDEFSGFGGKVKGMIIVDEEGLDVLYWRE
nr:formin-like protein 4 [Ipomoea batatas]